MGNQNNRPISVVDQINQFDPLIFPEVAEETDALRKKLQITKGVIALLSLSCTDGADFKIIEAPAITPEHQQLRQAVIAHNVTLFKELSTRPGFNVNAELDEKRRSAIQICALYPSMAMVCDCETKIRPKGIRIISIRITIRIRRRFLNKNRIETLEIEIILLRFVFLFY
jgi:hypothetical protein